MTGDFRESIQGHMSGASGDFSSVWLPIALKKHTKNMSNLTRYITMLLAWLDPVRQRTDQLIALMRQSLIANSAQNKVNSFLIAPRQTGSRSRVLSTPCKKVSPKSGRTTRTSKSTVLITSTGFESNFQFESSSGSNIFSLQRKANQAARLLERLFRKRKDGVTALRQICARQKKKFTVSVEGNIGCGKSTLIRYFEKFPKVETIVEPVDKWCNLQGHNALQLLYEDPARWNFTFNNYAMLTRLEMHMSTSPNPVRMLERSLYSTRYCFVENSFREGLLTGLEHAVLSEWFDYLVESQDIGVDLYVYLRASPEVCHERLRKRNRKEEAGVPLKFIEQLHDLHEEWLMKHKFPVDAPVLVLDASQELPRMKQMYEEYKQDILCGCT